LSFVSYKDRKKRKSKPDLWLAFLFDFIFLKLCLTVRVLAKAGKSKHFSPAFANTLLPAASFSQLLI